MTAQYSHMLRQMKWKGASIAGLLLALLLMGIAGCALAASSAPAPTATTVNSFVQPTAQSATAAPKAYIGLFKDNAVAVLDTATNRVLTKIPIPTGPHGLVVTPDGRTVYASSDGDSKVSVIDTATDKVTNTIEVGKMPHGLAITPNGKQVLVSVFGASTVAFIDTASNQIMGQVPVPNPHNIAISPDGSTAYVAAQVPNALGLTVIDVNKRTQTANVPLAKTPRALNFSPDGKLLYFTLAGVDSVQVLDPTSNKILTQIPVGASPHHPLFTKDGKEALIVSQGPGELDVVNPATNAVAATVKVGMMPHWIALTPNGQTAYVTNEASNDVSVVDLTTNQVTATIPVGNAPRKIVVQPVASTASTSQPKVVITGYGFVPQTLTVAPLQKVVWANADPVNHTVTSNDGLFDSADIMPGQDFTLTLRKPGAYAYHCTNHPFMQGVVIVRA